LVHTLIIKQVAVAVVEQVYQIQVAVQVTHQVAQVHQAVQVAVVRVPLIQHTVQAQVVAGVIGVLQGVRVYLHQVQVLFMGRVVAVAVD
jgi:hypothetical protein